jgi:hypothetical protein
MAAVSTELSGLPISPKKKLHIVIRDTFDEMEPESMDHLLSLLEVVGKRQTDLLRAVESGRSGAHLAVPEVHNFSELRAESLKTGVTLGRPPRCFQYDNAYFAPVRYFADSCDLDWVARWNGEHPFLPIGVPDLEGIFGVLEFIVKDFSTTEDPKLSRLMMLLPSDAPPFAVVKGIYDHWMQRSATKMNGSILKYRAYPPDHGELRKTLHLEWRAQLKPRKSLSDGDYIKRLFERLRDVQSERRKAIELLQRQEEAQVRDERFVRDAVKQCQKNGAPGERDSPLWGLMLPPAPRACERSEGPPPPPELTQALLPLAPSPVFLKWCARAGD